MTERVFTRGDTLEWPFTLLDGAVAANFDEIWFTVRLKLPRETVLDDTDADVIGQAKLTSGEIVFSTSTDGIITLPAALTHGWKAGFVQYDVQVRLTGTDKIKTLDSGRIRIDADVGRSQ